MMFQKKRLLKKEKVRHRFKYIFLIEILLFSLILILEFVYFNFDLGRSAFISPLANNMSSAVLNVEKELTSSDINFLTVSQTADATFTIKLKDGGVVILSAKKNIGKQIASLQLILSRLTIEGKKLKNLNFKFDKPVVTF